MLLHTLFKTLNCTTRIDFYQNCKELNRPSTKYIVNKRIFAFWVFSFSTLPTHLFAFLIVLLFMHYEKPFWRLNMKTKEKVVRKQSKKNSLMLFLFAC